MFLFSIFLLLLFKGATEGNIQDVDLRCTLEYCETPVISAPRAASVNHCQKSFANLEPNAKVEFAKKVKKTPDADFYPGYECDGDMCVCALLVNNQPLKIFGQFPANETQEKHCACSIFAYRAQKTLQQILPFPDILLPVPRCLPNGQFDALQCIDDMCGCVNPATGIWDSSVRKVAIGALGPGNPKCFDSKRHQPREYYTVCEKERNEMMQEIFWSERENVEIILSHKVECTPDGRYAN
ncbi:hypothetical protein RUM44_006595 [Polyplax serrata]|uniref:Thyroglobulin type-1 domain-containing protein n=1 Tax=Polyplax serrata TaxID=468196 RepID=A0ABR1AIK9_POLSC